MPLLTTALKKMGQHGRIMLYNLGYRLAGSIDGRPLPPAGCVHAVIGTREVAWYQLGGMFAHQKLMHILHTNGIRVEQLERILDFGCGCGRILRWFGALAGRCQLHGCDYNPRLIGWCRRRLSDLGTFHVNRAEPPLDLPDAYFDLVYSFSVFTHLRPELQKPWFDELRRVTKPGGHILITVHGAEAVRRMAVNQDLQAEQVAKFRRGELVVNYADRSGQNVCGAVHPESYVREDLARGLDVVDFVPHGMPDMAQQDVYLFAKPSATSGRRAG